MPTAARSTGVRRGLRGHGAIHIYARSRSRPPRSSTSSASVRPPSATAITHARGDPTAQPAISLLEQFVAERARRAAARHERRATAATRAAAAAVALADGGDPDRGRERARRAAAHRLGAARRREARASPPRSAPRRARRACQRVVDRARRGCREGSPGPRRARPGGRPSDRESSAARVTSTRRPAESTGRSRGTLARQVRPCAARDGVADRSRRPWCARRCRRRSRAPRSA